MSTSDHEKNPVTQGGEHDGKTVIMQRCHKHGLLHMPGDLCPECAKEKKDGSAA